MGLKTTNYRKKSGVVLETAYAWIHKLEEGRDFSTVEFHINETRESVSKRGADEVITYTYKTDLNNTGFNAAYAAAKKPVIRKVRVDVEKEGVIGIDESGNEIIGTYIEKEWQEKEFPNIFTNWEDDIVE